MTAPQFAPVDSPTADLLTLIANDPRREDEYRKFLRVAETDHECHGYVSVNRCRAALSNEYGLTIEPRRYASFWRRATVKGGPMRNLPDYELCSGSPSGNDGRPFRKRAWVGTSP